MVISCKTKMSVKDLSCEFHMPQELKSSINSNGDETIHRLPAYNAQVAYPVDEFPSCPSNWMHGSDMASSYFVKVKEGHGMWLNFNDNFSHTHDIAIVISIQGINPITGQPTIGSKTLRLEQYRKKCPVHNVDFQQDYFCPECKFKWPGQNYLSTTGTPFGALWIDGFRAPDGKVRQYVITADEKKGIAAQIIGEDRVFAIGIAYYLSKNKKPEAPKEPIRTYDYTKGGLCMPDSAKYGISNINTWNPPARNIKYGGTGYQLRGLYSGNNSSVGDPIGFSPNFQTQINCSNNSQSLGSSSVNNESYEDEAMCCFDISPVNTVSPVKNLEIGAGALISQKIYTDPKSIDYWEETPSGMIYVNYCDEKTFENIMKSGKRRESTDGFMNGLNVGSY